MQTKKEKDSQMPKRIAEKTSQVVMTSCWGWRKPLMAERDERKVTTMTSVTPGRISTDRSPWKDLSCNINAMKMLRNQICQLKTQVWDLTPLTPWDSHDIVVLSSFCHGPRFSCSVCTVGFCYLFGSSFFHHFRVPGCRAALRSLRCYNIEKI